MGPSAIMRSRGKTRPNRFMKWSPSRRLPKPYRNTYGSLFDIDYYLQQVEGHLHARDAVRHYEGSGAALGLSPSPMFSDAYYRKQCLGEEIENPVLHYLSVGSAQSKSPHPLFAPEWYTKSVNETSNADLDTTLRNNSLGHYLESGWRNSIAPHPLVCLPYATRFLPWYQRGKVEPLTFLIRNGITKFRRPHPLYGPEQLWASLKLGQIEISKPHQLATFANWPEPFSPSPFFWVDFYTNEHPESITYEGGPWQHFVNIGQFEDHDPNPYFDSRWYRERYSIDRQPLSPFLHYMTHELSQKFNPSPLFDTAHYLRTNPLVRKTRRSPLEHFLEFGRFSSAETHPFQAPMYVHEQVKSASILEPELANVQARLNRLKVYNRHHAVKIADLYSVLKKIVDRPFDALVTVPFLSRGGADLAACNLVRRLQQIHGPDQVLVILTDDADISSSAWLPPATRWLCFSHLAKKLSKPNRVQLLQLLIEDYLPTECYNVNSLACWQLLVKSGSGLSQICNLFAQLFCHDFDNDMQPKGYAVSYLGQTIDHLSGVFFDSRYFREHMIETIADSEINRNKLQTLYQPIKDFGASSDGVQRLDRLRRGRDYRRQVMWAGRLDRQKQPEVLAHIARNCPELDFHVFGTKVLNKNIPIPAFSENVTLHGEYAEFFDLPLDAMDVFLHTSAWDGLPLILIDVVQSGLPVVASQVGGVPELVDAETGWPVFNPQSADEYSDRLRQVCFSADNIETKISAAQERLEHRHSWRHYSETLERNRSMHGTFDLDSASIPAEELR
jgi:glycosyltransferase involved in cell wall biosynthesis